LSRSGRSMKRGRAAILVVVAFAVALTVACDPMVKKRKYMESGTRYLEQQKYREAVIQFSNAIQVDGNDPEAHYQLARSLFALKSYGNSYRELAKTVDLKPDHWAAQLDMGTMLLLNR